MNPEYFDIHSHLTDSQYNVDREEILSRLDKTNTYTITIGTDIETSKQAVALADLNKNIYACIGVHPVDDTNQTFETEKFESLANHPKVVSVGECGLDYFRLEGDLNSEKKRQKELFEKQIQFSLTYSKPLMLHCRGVGAYEDTLDVLESYKKEFGEKIWGNAHFFAGGMEVGKRFLHIDFSLSFTGVVTFTHDYDEVIRMAPLSMLMSETDAPYVAPVPYRGKRNEPSYVSEVVKKIAEIRGENFELVKQKLVENALKRFKISL